MDKEFVAYEPSLELKELGFDEPCLAYYDAWNGKFHLVITDQSGSFISKLFRLFRKTEHTTYFQDYVEYYFTGICTAPTFSQAFRWFREKYGVFSWLTKHRFNTTTSLENKEYYRWALEHEVVTSEPHINSEIIYSAKEFDTYEEAELACLIKLIEIVKDKP
jgi:hypothetical protein